MRKLKCLSLVAVLLACAPPAQAQMKEIARAGQWYAFSGHSELKQPTCGIGTKGKDWALWIKWADGTNYFQVQKQGWRIPVGTGLQMTLQIDENKPHTGVAIGRGLTNTIVANFNIDVFQTVVKEFISGKTMHVKFPDGNDRGWLVSLDGSDKMTRVYMKFVTDYEKQYQSPQPHEGGKEQKEGRT